MKIVVQTFDFLASRAREFTHIEYYRVGEEE